MILPPLVFPSLSICSVHVCLTCLLSVTPGVCLAFSKFCLFVCLSVYQCFCFRPDCFFINLFSTAFLTAHQFICLSARLVCLFTNIQSICLSFLCVSMSVYPSTCLSICLYVRLFIFCIYVSILQSVCLSVCLSLNLCMAVSSIICMSCLCVSMTVYTAVCLSIRLSVCLLIICIYPTLILTYVSVRLVGLLSSRMTVSVSVYLFVFLSVSASVCISLVCLCLCLVFYLHGLFQKLFFN